MKKIIPLIFVLAAGCASREPLMDTAAPSEELTSYSERITPDFLRGHLEVIAHDSLEGRETGMPGQKKAARYLSEFYREIGFAPKGDNGTYLQHYDLNADYTDSLVYRTYKIEDTDTLEIDHSVESPDSFGEYVRLYGGAHPLEGSVVFAGFGVNDPERGVTHLEGESLRGKWVMIFEEIPYTAGGDTLVDPAITSNSRIGTILGQYDAAGVLVISGNSSSEFSDLAQTGSQLLKKPANLSLAYLDEENGRDRSGFPKGFVQISPGMAARFLDLDSEEKLNDLKAFMTGEITEFQAFDTGFFLDYTPYMRSGTVQAENVIAGFEGADPDLKDEVLVLMAHYDHIGITQPDETGDMINNGADDDGSGTVSLMAIANALNEAALEGYRPARSVLFLHVSGEELGLLGSRYYSDHPVVPIEKTVTNFNADMIGRSDPENIERGDTDYVYLIGGEIISSELDSLVQAANQKSVNMRLDRKYNDLEDPNQFYRRSDHWNFGRFGVPFVFFFTGVHEDYHRPSDSVEKVDFEKLSRVARLIYTSAIEVANYDGRPEVDNQMFIDITNRMPR